MLYPGRKPIHPKGRKHIILLYFIRRILNLSSIERTRSGFRFPSVDVYRQGSVELTRGGWIPFPVCVGNTWSVPLPVCVGAVWWVLFPVCVGTMLDRYTRGSPCCPVWWCLLISRMIYLIYSILVILLALDACSVSWFDFRLLIHLLS